VATTYANGAKMKDLEALLQPFYGYLALAMYAEAHEELESLPLESQLHPAIQLARMELLMEMKEWKVGASLGQSLCGLWPDEFEFWFKAAYCLHEQKRTEEAKETLLTAPFAIRDTALYYYNLACYETQLGHLAEARGLLKVCFKKDEHFREEALDDPDLAPLRGSFSLDLI
jgi:tetratricopeptide (TPR) repeat protein